MKQLIITLVVGLAWMLMPQVANAQEQIKLMEMANRLYKQPQESKDLLEETYQLLKSNENTVNKKWDISKAQNYKEITDIAYQLIEIGNRNGTIDSDELLGYAKELVEVIEKWSSKSDEFNYRTLLGFRRDKGNISKALEKRKVIRQFVPYMKVYTEVMTQSFAVSILNLYAEQEKHTKNLENLKRYHEGIAKMNGNIGGIIAKEKAERDYKADMPFKDYFELNRSKFDNLAPTFLDEKFVFDQELKEQNQVMNYDPDIDEYNSLLPTDTFGITIDVWHPEKFDKKQALFINLRTGQLFLIWQFNLYKILESTTYLSKMSSGPDFVYDPSYSLDELFNYKWYYPENPEKMCKALEGLQVYRTRFDSYSYINDYDVIKSVKVERKKTWNNEPASLIYNVEYKNGKNPYDTRWKGGAFSVKWYEKLQKCIGMKVIYCNNGEERLLYKDFIDILPVWILESVALGKLDRDKSETLVAIIRKGEETKRLNAMDVCTFITHEDLNLYPGDNRYSSRLLPYEYVKEHSIIMPESMKSQLSWYAKTAKESMNQSLREIWVGQKVSLFLSQFPNAKLIKNTVSGGKTVKIYHVNGNEFVFKDGICTSVTKK